MWQILSLVDGAYRDLINIHEHKYYLVGDVFFLICCGLWTGFYFFIQIYVSSRHLVFPVIQQRKFSQFRSNVLLLFKESFSLSMKPTLYFIIIYYVWGSQIENSFMNFFSLAKSPNESSFLIYFYAWWFATVYFFSMNLIRFFFYLYLTEAVQFPIIKENQYVLSLQEAILMNNLPIIQNLACLDLFLLSHWSNLRRQIYFTLSQPGGHPHNWNNLIESVLKLFNDYIDLLKKSTENPLNQEKNKPDTISSSYPIQSPLSPNLKFRNLRNMSCLNNYIDDAIDVSHNLPETSPLDWLKTTLKEKITKFVNLTKILLGINFLFGELPQVNIQKCLVNGHLIIWASQGISELATKSLTEDKYGIVQKDLPVIITTLVQLKQSLDKLNKMPALSRKGVMDDFHLKMKASVSSALKKSLFNIYLHFGQFFHEFPLSNEVKQYLQVHVMCKNGCN